MSELRLVCEGTEDSIDVRMLTRAFVILSATEIIIESGEGIKQTSTVARFLERRGGRAAYVNDRDYRPREEADASFTNGKPGFLWRRHSIENYLLPPAVLLRAIRGLREQLGRQEPPSSAWLSVLPDDLESLCGMLRECARSRAAEEASRIANHRLWKELPKTLGRIQKRDPLLGRGDDRIDPIPWREALCQEVERVSNSAASTASCTVFSRQNAIRLFDASFDEITAEPYIGEMEFLIDFQGRDLLRELRLRVSAGRNALPDDRLVLAAAAEYEANPLLYGKDDFRDLANGVRALAGLDPV